VADTYTLEAQPRAITGKKVSQLRTQGLVPAVIYGTKVQPVHVQIPYRALEIILARAGGTHLIDIQVDGGTHSVLARDVQRDVIRRDILHVDFLEVDVNQTVRTIVPVHFVGESPAVQTRIGVLSHGANTFEVEALPRNLIDAIEVDVSGLKAIGDTIHVSDLNLPDTVTIHADPEDLVVRVNPVPQVVEEVETAEEETTSAEPEVIRRERAEDDEE
jgi:large subunit ribosomal protein L25